MNTPTPRFTRRRLFAALPGAILAVPALSQEHLSQSITFKGADRFRQIMEKAARENWRSLPMGQRVAKFAMELRGIPYVSYTLEIDNRVESASVNFNGLDCWTFFELAFGLARTIEIPKANHTPSDLLREIEWTRYRGGFCHGNYLDRIHYLAEWYFDNEARGNIEPMTKRIAPTERITNRKVQEMTVLWKSYRYLRNNPSLLPDMREHEKRIERYPFYFIPKDRVRSAEPKIQSGDIIGIVTRHHGAFCSHVGLAMRAGDNVCHFMHASKNYKKVVIDKSISGYLGDFSSHAGIIVARPLPRSEAITDRSIYAAKLKRITNGA